ncbi:PREDICTED: general transcription factor IIF subunit 1 [Ficedula albicollis]|uniref:general transcription factor IIF subunit 1 n=1 Tax=Ficedula albicollis TaxID=59894 RepID=UPI0007AD7AB9|nr:PREDICTED: general transcription factor IIF subunit 1 [Ficedula albicollis]
MPPKYSPGPPNPFEESPRTPPWPPKSTLGSPQTLLSPLNSPRRNKVLNHFSIMQQRRLRDQDEEEEDKDKGRKAPGKGGGLRIHDLEEDLELSSEESEGSEAEGEKAARPKAAGGRPKRKRRKGRKGSEDEALEDSDDGDFEGQEVDYMSDGSSSGEEEAGKAKAPKEEEEGPKGIDEASESSEESEEEKAEEKEEEEEGKATPTPQEKKKKRGRTSLNNRPRQELGRNPQRTGFMASSTPRKQRRVADLGGERHRQGVVAEDQGHPAPPRHPEPPKKRLLVREDLVGELVPGSTPAGDRGSGGLQISPGVPKTPTGSSQGGPQTHRRTTLGDSSDTPAMVQPQNWGGEDAPETPQNHPGTPETCPPQTPLGLSQTHRGPPTPPHPAPDPGTAKLPPGPPSPPP